MLRFVPSTPTVARFKAYLTQSTFRSAGQIARSLGTWLLCFIDHKRPTSMGKSSTKNIYTQKGAEPGAQSFAYTDLDLSVSLIKNVYIER